MSSFEYVSGIIRAGDALALSNLSFVRWVEIFHIATNENIESRMGAGSDVAKLWGFDGTDVNIGILDTGLSQAHPALQNFRFVDQFDYVEWDTIANDLDGHGTWVAGTAAGYDQGNTDFMGHAPLSNLLIYKLSSGWGGYDSNNVIDALTRGVFAGMNIANMSWGFRDAGGQYNEYSLIADRAVRGEFGRPITVVAAAGNYSEIILPPANAKNVITVGAVKEGSGPDDYGSYLNCSDSHFNWPPAAIACFSNHGPVNNDADGATRIKPDIVAPGVGINSSFPSELDDFDGQQDGYNKGDGTSAATPAVTGAAALMMDLYPDTRDWPELVKATLIASAIDLGDSDHYGHGLLNAAHATYAQPGIGGLTLLAGGTAPSNQDSHTWQFSVPSGYTRVRAVLAFSDIPGLGTYGETANDLDLYIYPTSDCSGTAIGPKGIRVDDTVEAVDFTPLTAPSQGGTWCARVKTFRYYEDSYGPATYGLAIYAEESEPYVLLDGWTELGSIFPGANFNIYTRITNWGNVIAGSYIKLSLRVLWSDFPSSRCRCLCSRW
jgi:hypothetical protein